MRVWILAFALGVIAGGYIPQLPSVINASLLLIAPLLSLRYRFLTLLSAYCLGIYWLIINALSLQHKIIPVTMEQQDIWVYGKVSDLPQSSDKATRIMFESRLLCSTPVMGACQQSLLSDHNRLLQLNDYTAGKYRPGEWWWLNVRLKRPRGFADPGGFDYEAWMFQQKITATGYIRQHTQNAFVKDENSFHLKQWFDRLRQDFLKQLSVLPLQMPGFFAALTVGDRFQISDEQWELLTFSGTNHLMVISGLHLSLVALLVYGMTLRLWRLFPRLCLCVPVMRAGAVVSLMAAFLYAGLAGFSLPVQRALIMICCVMAGQLLVRQTSATHNLCLALLGVLLLDPMAPLSTGFWLSFLAVSVLLLSLQQQNVSQPNSLMHRFKGLLRSQFYLFFGLMPLMMLLFQQFSLLAPVVNLFAIPFVGLLVVPLCLAALFSSLYNDSLFVHLAGIADFLLSSFIEILSWLSARADFLLLEVPALPGWLLCLLLIAILLMFFSSVLVTRLLLLMVLALVFYYRPQRPLEGEFLVDILDVGQGLAVIISTTEHSLFYDTGPAYSLRFNAGSGIIQPFMRRSNLLKPNVIMVSHGDNDHAGGLAALAKFYPQAKIIAGETLKEFPLASTCLALQPWVWDKVKFEILYADQAGFTGNNASCVLKVSTGPYSILLPGDIEQPVELALLKNQRMIYARIYCWHPIMAA